MSAGVASGIGSDGHRDSGAGRVPNSCPQHRTRLTPKCPRKLLTCEAVSYTLANPHAEMPVMKALTISTSAVPSSIIRSTMVMAVALAIYGCTASTGPTTEVTLAVSNTTCLSGVCRAIQVRAYPAEQPSTPGGLWSIEVGVVSGAAACLVLPTSGTFKVGDAEGVTYEWTLQDSVALGAIEESTPLGGRKPSTNYFVPASASGWTVGLPGAAAVVASGACS